MKIVISSFPLDEIVKVEFFSALFPQRILVKDLAN